MRIRKIEISDILSFLGDTVLSVDGNIDGAYIDNLADVENTNLTTLDWVHHKKENKQIIAENSAARVLLVDNELKYSEFLKKQDKILIHVANPKYVLAKIGNHFFIDKPDGKTHPTAIIDPDAKIGRGVSIGAYSVIGRCVIGNDTCIDSNVHIYDDVTIGKNCVVKSGAVIGGEGFGFERDDDGNLCRFPQIGDVKIGNFVEIGANTCIDRGALSSTMIGDYTKINNLCHIAHNNKIGKNVVIAAEVNVSGGNIIEDDVWISPSSSLRGYVHIGKGSTVGTGAIVVKDIPANEVWVGNPAKKLR